VGKIGYANVVALLGDILSQDDGLTLKADGIYVVLPPEDILILLTPDEIEAISMHPKNDLTKPALKFPCTIKEFESFVEFFGLDDEVVRERMKKFSATIKQEPPRTRNQDNILLIKRTLNELRKVLGREPSSAEVWDDLEQYDEDEVIGSDSNNDVLYWNPRSGGVKKMTRKTFNNQVAILKKKVPSS